MMIMHQERISRNTRFLIITAILIGFLSVTILPAAADTPDPSAANTAPDFWQNLITAFRNLIAGVIPDNTSGLSPAGTPGKESGNPIPVTPAGSQKVIATCL